jgi:hypothetical protein
MQLFRAALASLVAVPFGIYATHVAYGCSQTYTSRKVDHWLSKESTGRRAKALILKSEFQEMDIKALAAPANHTHGASAAQRSTASYLAKKMAENAGYTPMFFQGSGADSRAGRSYSRSYYWVKDLMAPASYRQPEPGDALIIIDVDYYVETFEADIARWACPVILYTLVPSQAGRATSEYSYCFESDGKIYYQVSGGGEYRHHLWNWGGDSLTAVAYSWWGFPNASCHYAVERRQVGEDHQMVLLAPLLKTEGVVATLVSLWKLAARRMARLRPIVGDFVRLQVRGKDEHWWCTGRVNTYLSSKLPATVDDAIASTARQGTTKLTLYTVKSKMDNGETGLASGHHGAEIALEFHSKYQKGGDKIDVVDAVRSYQWIETGVIPDEDAKAGMTAFMSPLLDGAFVPDVSKANESRCVDQRVRKVQTPDLPLDKFTISCIDEFSELIIPLAHTLHPFGDDEVYARQSRPSQRRILDSAQDGVSNDSTSQFVKREAYGSVTDPRPISQINGVDKLAYSAFMYAFVDEVLKPQPWYAFGKSPLEVATRVTEICSRAEYVDATDFSRMDGRVGNIARYLERTVMRRAFSLEHWEKLYVLMQKQTFLRARTVFGIKYRTAHQRLSGSPETSGFNTLLTAFINYMTFRRQRDLSTGMFHPPNVAWSMLGIYGGDDGLSTGLVRDIAIRTAKSVGQVLDLQRTQRGRMGVMFLARCYGPGVWFGDTTSCCDLKRQLAKFHVTVNLPLNITPTRKLIEKAYAFSLTDRHTPILGEFCNKVLHLFRVSQDDFTNVLGIWGLEHDQDRQYPNRPGDWMDEYAHLVLPDFDVTLFREWLRTADCGTILSPPRFATSLPPDSKPGLVTVDGDVKATSPRPDGSTGGTSPKERRTPTTPRYRPRKPATKLKGAKSSRLDRK